jgi:zinc and cadmium transporter
MVSFSAGALFGDVFLHLLPEIVEEGGWTLSVSLFLMGGILISFVIEKMIHWHHCHVLPTEDHYHPVGTMSLIGDALHNALDGILIAGSFLISPSVGIATTIAVILHEIPQEIGDFALLLFSGFSRKTALLFNFSSALTAFLGGGIVLLFASSIPSVTSVLIPLAAGNFLYIAGSDLLPELHRETRLPQASLQLVLLLAGIGVMLALTFLE